MRELKTSKNGPVFGQPCICSICRVDWAQQRMTLSDLISNFCSQLHVIFTCFMYILLCANKNFLLLTYLLWRTLLTDRLYQWHGPVFLAECFGYTRP